MNLSEVSIEDLAAEISRRQRCPRVVRIIRLAAEIWGVDPHDILGRARTVDVANARSAAMFAVRHVTRMTLPDIGRAFGNRDHTTAIWNIRRAEDLRDGDNEFARRMRELMDAAISNAKDDSPPIGG